MFDKLIESNAEGAEFKGRSRYFMVSSAVVGLLFLAAVVASIYAGEIGLGTFDLEFSELLAPMEVAVSKAEPPAVLQDRNAVISNALPTRRVNMERVDESPLVPDSTSITPNTYRSRPNTDFQIDLTDTDPTSSIASHRSAPAGNNDVGLAQTRAVEVEKKAPEPPPAPKAPVPPPIKTLGVVNGIATALPKPAYPAPAIAMNIQGKVDVQVMIDERGKVVSSRALNGHPILRAPAENAAWNARFSPTLLSNVPVKVSGVIVYNFVR